MLIIIAILLPPLGMLMCGKPFEAILCVALMLCLIGWPVASIWAVIVVMDHKADVRSRRVERAMRNRDH